MESRLTRLDYCQFLLSSQVNYTLTHFAEHSRRFSHDLANRYLARERITPRLVWENVRGQVTPSASGCVVFDDTVLDKSHSSRIALVRRQYSGNAHSVIRGIGVVNCVYVNPETQQFWVIDYRIHDPEGDGKTKLHHVKEMLNNLVHHKQLAFKAVLMDSWYAAKWLMLHIESLKKLYYCPLKSNRLVNESGQRGDYHRVNSLAWSAGEELAGKQVHLRDFPKGHQLKLFRLPLSTKRTDYVVTNDPSDPNAEAVQEASGLRWKVEQFHREEKQLTGSEACQCRRARIQRNHIGCAVLVWLRLKNLACQSGKTVCQIKRGLLSEFLIQQLRSPAVKMTLE